MTLNDYKKAVRNLLKWTIVGLPFLAKFIDKHSGMPFPPIGPHLMMWRFAAVLVIAAATLLPHALRLSWSTRSASIVLGLLFVSSGYLYWRFESKYVIDIDYGDGDTRYYTIGSERAPDLQEPYRSMKDRDLVKSAGQSNSYLEDVYTRDSLNVNRARLYGTYLLTLSLFEFWLGTLVLADHGASRTAANA